MRVVALPGGGTARVHSLTGRDEDCIARDTTTAAALATTALIGSCVEIDGAAPSAERARTLLVGDREFLMLQLRRETLGERVFAVVGCSACGADVDVAFDAADVPVETPAAVEPRAQIRYRGRTIAFRLPTGDDQEAVIGLGLEDAEALLLDRCVDGGAADLSRGARDAVVAAMERRAPRIDLELDVVCPECGAAHVVPFDVTAFFLGELGVHGDRLLREIHALALAYHWSEEAILALPRKRRRAYLSLVGGAGRG
jgi:hypothetical protein